METLVIFYDNKVKKSKSFIDNKADMTINVDKNVLRNDGISINRCYLTKT